MKGTLSATNNPLGRTIHTIPVEKLQNSYPGKMVTLTEVKASIKAVGLMNPLLVLPEVDGIYKVHVGNNRFLAARKLGYTAIDCYIAEPDDDLKYLDKFFKMKPEDFPR